MGNLTEKNRRDYETRFKARYREPMARKPVSVILPVDKDEYVRSLPNRTEWLREAIAEKIEREINKQQDAS